MNLKWKAFLQENGATFASATRQLLSFDDSIAETQVSAMDVVLSTPSDRGLLKITGEDAEIFLQNQFTNDIRNVTESTHQASAWCSPKGRIIANFQIFQRDDAYYLSLANDLAEHIIKKLRMYVMMSKVVIEDVTDTLAHFVFAAKNADELMQKILGIEINLEDSVIHYKSLTLLRYTHDMTRFDVFGDIEDAANLWSLCRRHAKPVSSVGEHYLNILAGRPEITAASSEAWIPQMVNYTHLGGVDFKKGCYPGQEVVARLNYLGKTKRRMYHLEIDTADLPEVGDAIKSDKEAEVGKILNAVINAENTIDALAVLKIAEASNSLKMAKNDAIIAVLDLPYSVGDE